MKAVQTQQEMDIASIKDIIASQQRQIEFFDERARRCNLILSNVPETTVKFDREELDDDMSKFVTLANEILPACKELEPDDIVEVIRVGRPGRNPRLLKVKLSEERLRNDILRSGKNLGSKNIRAVFGAVDVNKDVQGDQKVPTA